MRWRYSDRGRLEFVRVGVNSSSIEGIVSHGLSESKGFERLKVVEGGSWKIVAEVEDEAEIEMDGGGGTRKTSLGGLFGVCAFLKKISWRHILQ